MVGIGYVRQAEPSMPEPQPFTDVNVEGPPDVAVMIGREDFERRMVPVDFWDAGNRRRTTVDVPAMFLAGGATIWVYDSAPMRQRALIGHVWLGSWLLANIKSDGTLEDISSGRNL